MILVSFFSKIQMVCLRSAKICSASSLTSSQLISLLLYEFSFIEVFSLSILEIKLVTYAPILSCKSLLILFLSFSN